MRARDKLVRYERVKRLLDVVIASALLVLALPLLIVLIALTAVTLGRPIFFRQRRPGKDNTIFTLIKLRTMKDPHPERGLVTDVQRLTRCGRFLRSTSLDELPTLLNVVIGHMSMVGPRPLLVEYLDRYTPEQARRHEVRPGITGLAQVSGRNGLLWEQKFQLDIEYVNTRCFAVDVRILARTIATVLLRTGISRDGHSTSPEFKGSHSDAEADTCAA